MDLDHDLSLELGPLEPPLAADTYLAERTTDSQHVPEPTDPQPPSNAVKQVNRFCTPSNFASAANYVNLLLTAEGYPVPLIFKSNDDEDICKIINCFRQVLEDKRNDAQERMLLAEKVNALKQERQNLQAALDSCRKELDESKNENMRLSSRLETANKLLKEESSKLRSAKDELTKAKNNMQYMKAQYAHEVRRHEQDHAKTKERLYKLMDERTRTNVASYTVNEALPVDAFDNGNQGAGENTMYTDLLAKSSDREKEARIENDSLRRLFADIYAAVADLLQRQSKKYTDTFPKSPPSASSETVNLFRLPIDVGCTKAIEETHKLLARLQEEWDRQISKRKVYSEEDMQEKEYAIRRLEQSNDELIETLRICQVEYEQKAKMYMRYADGGFFDNVDPNADASLSDSESSVMFDDHETETSIKKLRKSAIAERRKATEAAIKLGDERTRLQAERWAFEEMKLQLQMQSIFSDTTVLSSSRKRAREDDTDS